MFEENSGRKITWLFFSKSSVHISRASLKSPRFHISPAQYGHGQNSCSSVVKLNLEYEQKKVNSNKQSILYFIPCHRKYSQSEYRKAVVYSSVVTLRIYADIYIFHYSLISFSFLPFCLAPIPTTSPPWVTACFTPICSRSPYPFFPP